MNRTAPDRCYGREISSYRGASQALFIGSLAFGYTLAGELGEELGDELGDELADESESEPADELEEEFARLVSSISPRSLLSGRRT